MGLHPLSTSFYQFSYFIIQTMLEREKLREKRDWERETWDEDRDREKNNFYKWSQDTSIPLNEHLLQREPQPSTLQWISGPR